MSYCYAPNTLLRYKKQEIKQFQLVRVYQEISDNSLEGSEFGQVFSLTSNNCSLGKKSVTIVYELFC